ncbi:MAG: hypothetical protein SOW59_08465 [Corynebacterium sp.]|nr:hypothetical protein [Corynebacterium sp.]
MIDPHFVLDSATTVLAQMDVFNTTPTAPDGFTQPVSRLVGIAKWVGYVLIGVGVIVMGASMAISRREGTSEEATANAVRIGAAAMLIGGVSSILSILMGG